MLKEMEYVYAVYEEKSFSKAARKLFISQPALSAAIKKAEEEIKTPIFDRSSKPVSLTEAGEYYIQRIEKIMAIQREMQAYFAQLSGEKSEQLNIGSSSYFCTFVLPGLLSGLRLSHPHSVINLHEGNTAQLAQLLREEKIDLVLEVESLNERQFTSYRWKNEHILLAVPAGRAVNEQLAAYRYTCADIRAGRFAASEAPAVELRHFKREQFLLLKRGSDMYRRGLAMCKKSGFSPQVALFVDQMLTTYYQAQNGEGIAFIRDSLPGYVDDEGRLFFYKIADELAAREVNISVKSERALPETARELLQYMLGANQ